MLKNLIAFTFFLYSVSSSKAQDETFLRVKPGNFNPTPHPIRVINNKTELVQRIKFSANCARYLFTPNDPKGHFCSRATNKLYGATHCGIYNTSHKDSDRFVWRRSQSCLKFQSPYVLGQVENCAEKDLIEIAAYAYDNGDIPYEPQNQGRLLKVFKTKVKIETWYIYKLLIKPLFTVYQLLDNDNNLLETVKIEHRDCGSSYSTGRMETLYFGGKCPAPQEVSVTYKPL